MDIQRLSMESAQAGILDKVGMAMLSKTLRGAQEQSADLLKLIAPQAPLPEGSGTRVDLFA